jgi:GWxTD domain-containing protein
VYIFEMQLADNNSTQTLVGEFQVVVRDFSASVSMSDITLLDSYEEETYSIIPLVDHRLTTADGGIQIFYETYSDAERELSIVREVLRVQKDAGVPELNGMLDTVVREGVSASVEIREEELSVLPAGRGQQVVRLSADDLKVGTYLVRVSLVDPVDGVLDVAEKSFSTLWGGLDAHIEDIDNAISQLEYIAKKKDLQFIREAQSNIERLDRFRDFWIKRDPTPNTLRNERMEEYYYRVDSANRQYGSQQDGWKTDRGYIYVTYGEPDHIERNNHSFDYQPHEVWVYERLGRQFIFVDKTGFGDFELLLPAWDERTRLY